MKIRDERDTVVLVRQLARVPYFVKATFHCLDSENSGLYGVSLVKKVKADMASIEDFIQFRSESLLHTKGTSQ